MRVSTQYTFDAGVQTLQRRQRELADSQLQLTSGKRVQRASDDPTAAARAERALAAAVRTEAEQRAIEASRNVMVLAESALGDAGELMQQARELLVAAGNAAYSDADRRTLADQIYGLRRQLLAIANRSDGAGQYLFAGQGAVQPFADAFPDGVAFQGVSGDFLNAAREPMPLSVDGEAAWLGGAPGGVFGALDRAIAALDPSRVAAPPPPATPAEIAAAGLGDLDAAMDAVLRLRARIGELLNRADAAEGRAADERLYHQTERSNAEDLDLVQAISEFQTRQTGYDAALKAYASVQRMSLFQYLNG